MDVSQVTFEGDVSSSLRKGIAVTLTNMPTYGWWCSGQKLICYEMAIKIEWKGHFTDASGDSRQCETALKFKLHFFLKSSSCPQCNTAGGMPYFQQGSTVWHAALAGGMPY